MLCKTPFFGSIRARLLTRISIRFTIEGRHLMIDFIFEHYGIPTDISELEAGQ